MTITQGFHRKKFCFVSWSIAVWEEKGREKVKMETGLYWWNYCQVKTLSPIFFHAFIPTINPKIAFASTAYKALTAFQERDTRDVVGIL